MNLMMHRAERARRELVLGLSMILVVGGLVGCSSGREKNLEVEVEVKNVAFDQITGSPVLILEDKAHRGQLPMAIGAFEAQAIAMELKKVETPRPLTHDLITSILQQVGVGVERVLISDLRNNTYYAHIFLLKWDEELVDVDSRPSDAVAIALRFGKPIYVLRRLLISVREPVQEENASYQSHLLLGARLQDVSPEVAEYFGIDPGVGVLVSEGTEKGKLRPGDVILRLNGAEIRGVADLRHKLGKLKEDERLELEVERDGDRVSIGSVSQSNGDS